MIRTLSITCLFCFLPACGAEASGGPSDEELLAANPGGTIFVSIDSLDIQVHGPVPACLFGDGYQVARGVSKSVEGAESEGGGTPVNRWGLWHYYHLDSGVLGGRDSWGKLGQRGEFRDGMRVGRWAFWYPDGARRGEGEFRDGKMHGQWQVWTSSGELDAEHSGLYENGEKVN